MPRSAASTAEKRRSAQVAGVEDADAAEDDTALPLDMPVLLNSDIEDTLLRAVMGAIRLVQRLPDSVVRFHLTARLTCYTGTVVQW